MRIVDCVVAEIPVDLNLYSFKLVADVVVLQYVLGHDS